MAKLTITLETPDGGGKRMEFTAFNAALLHPGQWDELTRELRPIFNELGRKAGVHKPEDELRDRVKRFLELGGADKATVVEVIQRLMKWA